MIFIYTTYPDLSSAKKTIQSLLDRRLIACANIIPGMTSIYRWQDKVEESNELVVIFKTRSNLFEACKVEIQNEHPYQVPCILQIDIPQGESKYLDWLRKETEAID